VRCSIVKASPSGEGEVPSGSEAEGMGSTRTAGSCCGHPYPQIPSVCAERRQLPLKLQGEPLVRCSIVKASPSGEGEVPNVSEAEGMGSARTAGSCCGHPYPQIPSVCAERRQLPLKLQGEPFGAVQYRKSLPLGRRGGAERQ